MPQIKSHYTKRKACFSFFGSLYSKIAASLGGAVAAGILVLLNPSGTDGGLEENMQHGSWLKREAMVATQASISLLP